MMQASTVFATGDQIPIYPHSVQGDLRLILQIKDLFLLCYKHTEEYQGLIDEQHRLITKEFVEDQLKMGDKEIQELKNELSTIQHRMSYKVKNNEKLADLLIQMGVCDLQSMDTRRTIIIKSPTMHRYKRALETSEDDQKILALKEDMLMKLCEIQTDNTKLLSLLEYYRELYYYQLHFIVVQTQLNHYTMPLVTENIGLLDRIFFWSQRPEFTNMRKTGGELSDRLTEIYTRVQQILVILGDSTLHLRNQVAMQKAMETRFHRCLEHQEKCKDSLMRSIHNVRQDIEILEEENDRLVGIIVKLEPEFVETQEFLDIAEDSVRRNMLYNSFLTGNKKTGDQALSPNSFSSAKLKNAKQTLDNVIGLRQGSATPTVTIAHDNSPKSGVSSYPASKKTNKKLTKNVGKKRNKESSENSSSDVTLDHNPNQITAGSTMQAFSGELIAEVVEDEDTENRPIANNNSFQGRAVQYVYDADDFPQSTDDINQSTCYVLPKEFTPSVVDNTSCDANIHNIGGINKPRMFSHLKDFHREPMETGRLPIRRRSQVLDAILKSALKNTEGRGLTDLSNYTPGALDVTRDEVQKYANFNSPPEPTTRLKGTSKSHGWFPNKKTSSVMDQPGGLDASTLISTAKSPNKSRFMIVKSCQPDGEKDDKKSSRRVKKSSRWSNSLENTTSMNLPIYKNDWASSSSSNNQ